MSEQIQQINPQRFSLLCRVIIDYLKDDLYMNGLYFEENYCLLRWRLSIILIIIYFVGFFLECFIYIVYPDLYFFIYILLLHVYSTLLHNVLHIPFSLCVYVHIYSLHDVYSIWHYVWMDLIVHMKNKDWIKVYFFHTVILFWFKTFHTKL